MALGPLGAGHCKTQTSWGVSPAAVGVGVILPGQGLSARLAQSTVEGLTVEMKGQEFAPQPRGQ